MNLKRKEINEISKILKKFLKQNKFDCTDVRESAEFWYDENTEIIYYAFAVTEEHDELFKEFFYKLGLNYDCDNFLLSFFHELGHHETLCLLSAEERDRDEAIIEEIESRDELDINSYKEYYELETEFLASQWAAEYINNHPEKVKALWEKLQPHILKFYKDNNVET